MGVEINNKTEYHIRVFAGRHPGDVNLKWKEIPPGDKLRVFNRPGWGGAEGLENIEAKINDEWIQLAPVKDFITDKGGSFSPDVAVVESHDVNKVMNKKLAAEAELAKAKAIDLNAEGNELFKEGKYEEAIEKYNQALETTSNENHKVTYRNNIKLSKSNLEAKATSEEDGSDQSYKQEYGRDGYENEDNLNAGDAEGEYDYDRHQEAERDREAEDREEAGGSTDEVQNQINTSKIQELQEQELSQLEEEIQKLQLGLDELKNVNETQIFEQGIHFYEEIPIDIKYEIEKLYNDSEELRERDYEDEQQGNSMVHTFKKFR